ncbi:acyltransferase family protein [Nocardioides taihuensis]|uniref:Acyltransferase family protein n=1 Tax=Nocardioides taihuensis TaxID=1835606 RepID=A0ABW0BES6_9ACTN
MRTGDTWRLGYVPALDGCRAIAVSLVVGYHADWLIPGGYLGVDVFFALSGFLITTLLLAEHDRTGGIALRSFWWRRGRRLMPALLVLVAVTWMVERNSSAALRTVTYTSNVAAATGSDLGSLGHTWSLALEEQFYLLWPLLLVILLYRRPQRLEIAGFLVVAAAALYVWAGHLFLTFGQGTYFRPESRAATLMLGCALAFISSTGPGRAAVARCGLPLGVAGVVVLGLLAATVPPPSLSAPAASAVLFPVAGVAAAALVASLAMGEHVLTRAAAVPALVWVGQISYSIYLWHVLVLHYTAEWPLPVRVGLVLAAATASHHFVERPAGYTTPRGQSVVVRRERVTPDAKEPGPWRACIKFATIPSHHPTHINGASPVSVPSRHVRGRSRHVRAWR